MKILKMLMVLVMAGALAPPLHSDLLLLQSGFSDGSIRSTASNLVIEHSSGVMFSGWSTSGDLGLAAGLYGLYLTEFYPNIEEMGGQAHEPAPEVVLLMPPFPNPSARFSLKFYLPKDEDVELVIYNSAGSRIRTLAHGRLQSGWHRITWNGTDDWHVRVAAGVYFCQLRTPSKVITKKLVLAR